MQCTGMRPWFLFVCLALFATAAGPLSADEVVSLDTRPGVTQSFLLLEPAAQVQGVVLMFPGHEGVVRFVEGPEGYSVENEGGGFTVRKETREIYRRNGLAVALLAPPSDRLAGMDTAFRSSPEHARDVQVVLNYLKERYGRKPWLHGHCRGTFSPAAVATRLGNEDISGLVLSSARSRGRHGAVTDYTGGVVDVPVLLVQHREDPCKGTPYRGLEEVRRFYATSAERVDVIEVTGGDTTRTGDRPCEGGAHSFRGLETETATAITDWILGKDFVRDIHD